MLAEAFRKLSTGCHQNPQYVLTRTWRDRPLTSKGGRGKGGVRVGEARGAARAQLLLLGLEALGGVRHGRAGLRRREAVPDEGRAAVVALPMLCGQRLLGTLRCACFLVPAAAVDCPRAHFRIVVGDGRQDCARHMRACSKLMHQRNFTELCMAQN